MMSLHGRSWTGNTFATGADSSEPAMPRQQAAPAISPFVIDKSLSGQVQDIKGRTLGVEVFDREIHYDLSNDPIVRVAAGDIRKRLAQYHVRWL